MAKIPPSSDQKKKKRAARVESQKARKAEQRAQSFNNSRPGLEGSPEDGSEDFATPEAVTAENSPAEHPPVRLHFERLFARPEGTAEGDISFWQVSEAGSPSLHPLSPRSVVDSDEDLPVASDEEEDLALDEVEQEVAAVMAHPDPPPAEEAIRLQIEDDLAQFKANMDKVPPNTRQATINNTFVETELKKLQSTTYTRLARLDAAAKAEHKAGWVEWKTNVINLLDQEQVRLEEALAGGSSDQLRANAVTQEKAVVEARIQRHVQLTRDKITALEAAIRAHQPDGAEAEPREIPRAQFVMLSGRLDDIKQMVRQQLQELHDQLIKVDPAAHVTVFAALKLLQDELEPMVETAKANLHGLNLEASLFQPAGASTPNVSVANDLPGSSGSGKGSGAYGHIRTQVPVFSGDYAEYPGWKAEFLSDILPGRSQATCLRLMALHCPEKDLAKRFKTKEEAFKYLDHKFANPVAVAETVVEKFLGASSVDGATDQAKVVELNKVLQTLYTSLEVVKQERQLTHSIPMVNRAVKLLPQKYREEFADKVDDAEEALGTDLSLTAPQKWALLKEWLENKARKLTIYCSDTMKKGRQDRADKVSVEKSETQKLVHMVQQLTDRFNNLEKKPPGGAKATGGNSNGRGSSRHGDCTSKIPASQLPAIKEKWTKMGKCPLCKSQGHVFEGRKGWFASDSLADCKRFVDMKVDERAKFVMDSKICDNCLSWGHEIKDCRKPDSSWYCRVKDNSGNLCKGKHSRYLHGTTVQLSNHFLVTAVRSERSGFAEESMARAVMLPVMNIAITPEHSAVTLFDGGATCSLIRNGFAERLGLKAHHTKQVVTLCGKEPETMDICYYLLEIDSDFGTRKILVLGLDRLSTIPAVQSFKFAYQVFKHLEPGQLERAQGELDLIVGQDQSDLQPGGGLGVNQAEGLRLWETPFAGRRVLTGAHDQITFTNPEKSEEAQLWNHVTFRPPVMKQSFCVNNIANDFADSFLEAEMMGYDLPAKCGACQKCPTCTMQTDGITVKHFRELQMLRDSIRHDPATNTVHCSYPIVGDISKFVDNRAQAISRWNSTERSLKSRGLLDQYCEQVEDYKKRGVWEEVTVEQIEQYKAAGGSVHYCAHHGVEKPSSLSTSLRIVVDSALQNNWNGPRLRDLYAKGPNFINDLFKVLICWRGHVRGGCFDVKKAYHSLNTGEAEFYMRLVVWRDPKTGKLHTFGHRKVGMGDVSASVLLELSKEIAAEVGRDIDPLLAVQFVLMSYVDDGLIGGSQQDVERMRGELSVTETGALTYTGTITRMLAIIGCLPKVICISGETDQRILSQQGKVLGIQWEPTEDTLSYKPAINLSERRGAARLGPDLNEMDQESIDGMVLTRRIVLQAAQQNFDPLGQICPYTVKYKLLMKEIVSRELTWDVPLPSDLQSTAKELIKETIGLPEIKFPRSLSHDLAVDRPELLVYTDGSCVAFGAVLYMRWKLSGPGAPYNVTMITAKTRVTPKAGMSAPRSELQALVVGVRLATKVLEALSVRPARVTIMTDSQCSVAACDLNASSLQMFFRNRVLEIVTKMHEWGPVDKLDAKAEMLEADTELLSTHETEDKKLSLVDLIHHIPGEGNPADMPTRDETQWSDLEPGKVWQDGPAYLLSPRSTWPMSREGNFISKLPPEEKAKRFLEPGAVDINVVLANKVKAGKAAPPLSKVLDVLNCSDKWLQVRNTLARLVRMWRYQNRAQAYADIELEDLKVAEWLAALASQVELWLEMKANGSQQALAVFQRDGVARSRGRMDEEDMVKTTGYDSLVVLPQKSRLALLLTLHAHRDDHRAGGVVQRVRRLGYWIIRGNNLAKTVVKNCVPCRKYKPVPLEQKMADLPRVLMDVPVRPFTNICLDYTGAITIKAMTNKRSTMKVWPLVMVCVNTGSVHIELAQDYSTAGFMLAFNQFTALRGVPSYVRADMGSQLTAATATIQDGDLPRFRWKEIARMAITHGTEFTHCATQAQWRNGRAESAVRALKRTLRHLHHGQTLNFAELACMLSRAAAIINRRPIGVRHHGGGDGEMCVITPELLLHGGRLCAGPEHGADLTEEFRTVSGHMAAMEQSFLNWWRLWFEQVWESLVPYKKWRVEHRNVKVDDVVLLSYTSKVSAPSYRYGRVLQVHPDKHGVVRNVTVATKSRRVREKPRALVSTKLEEQYVPVQRLVMLLPVEEQSSLPPASESLHICEEDFRVPAADLPSSPHRGASPSQPTLPAPGPTDPDLRCARAINTIVLSPSSLPDSGDYICPECAVRVSKGSDRK